jgi:hypothetical protein
MLALRHLGYEEHLWAHHQPSLIWRLSKQVATQLRQRGRVRGRIRFGVGSLAHLLKETALLRPVRARGNRAIAGSTDRWDKVSLLPASGFPDRPQIFPAEATREFCW